MTIKPFPDKGYTVETVIVTDQNGDPVQVKDNGDGTYSFNQPDSKVKITVDFQRASTVADPEITGVAGLLNTVDHIAYLHGYTNGNFGPNDNMTEVTPKS